MQLRFHLKKTLQHALFLPVVFHICTPQLQLEQLAIPATSSKLCYHNTLLLQFKPFQVPIYRKNGWRCFYLI